jgi:hypothetical protein
MKFSNPAELMHAELISWLNKSSVGRASPRAEVCWRQRLAGTLAPPFLRCILFVCVVISLLAVGCSQKSGETPASAGSEKKEESRVTHGTNGETIIKLDAETQKLMGLQTAVLSSAELNPEIKGFGRVLDTAPLASLVADLMSASAASHASQAELERLKALAAQNNASARALQAAEAAAVRDGTQTEAARLKLVAGWGSAIAARQDLAAFVRSLGSLESALVQISVSPDRLVKQEPTGARISTISDETKPVSAQFISPAPSVDPQVQGQGFLFLISPNPSRLAPGAAVTGFLEAPGEKQTGVAVPRNAIVRFNGTAWVYVQTGDETFERTEARLERPLQDAWFVRGGLKPETKVVTTGAQQMLSEELKGEAE